jgi:centrobin
LLITDGLNLVDVSELLRLYQARGWGALPAEDLLLYLKRLEHSGYEPGRERKGFKRGIWIRS